MRYLENLALENLTKEISNRELGGGLLINGRVECYSAKRMGDEKKQSKVLEQRLTESAGNDLNEKTKRIYCDLIQTLNASMVDYDFSELTADSFAQTSVNEAVQTINSNLAELTVSSPNFLNQMWGDISHAIGPLVKCEVYKLVDGAILDDVENGSTWSFHYFLCNRELKRVCYFTCQANSKYRKTDTSLYMEDSEEEEDPVDSDEEGIYGSEDDEMDTWN